MEINKDIKKTDEIITSPTNWIGTIFIFGGVDYNNWMFISHCNTKLKLEKKMIKINTSRINKSLAASELLKYLNTDEEKKLYNKFIVLYQEYKEYMNNMKDIKDKKTLKFCLFNLRETYLTKIKVLKLGVDFKNLSRTKNEQLIVNECVFSLMENIIVSEFRNMLDDIKNSNRYVVEKRVGCAAILDTHSETYKKRLDGDRNGLSKDDDDVVYWINGFNDGKKWRMKSSDMNTLMAKLKVLNSKF